MKRSVLQEGARAIRRTSRLPLRSIRATVLCPKSATHGCINGTPSLFWRHDFVAILGGHPTFLGFFLSPDPV